MEKPQKKPPSRVLSIRGDLHDDVIQDEDLEIVSDLQAAAWKANKAGERAFEKLERRIAHGAFTKSSKWYVDKELGMVRSRKEQKAGN